ncbi:uncharacterized protein TNCV_2378481 [Trichonephila clavipes]|nr:uncharacterized protein TNCV_2378481 [Trichonephila clavipes]
MESKTLPWCQDILRDFQISRLQSHECLQDIILIQDVSPLHIDRRVKQLLKQHFPHTQIISCHFPTVWLPRSLEFTPCTFDCGMCSTEP